MLERKSMQEFSNISDKFIVVILLFTPSLLINQVLDNDIWFILNNGRYVFQYGIPYIEPFTIHQGMSYVMQQWLSSIIFWIMYSSFGKVGLVLITFLAYVGIIYTVFKFCMRISENNFFVSHLVSMFVSIFTNIFMIQRPYIFFILIIAIELYLLESFILTDDLRYLYFLPLLSILLINLQAAMWPILFIILIPYVIDSIKFKLLFIKGQGYSKKTLFTVIVIMILVGFINPYGLEAMTYIFRSYGYWEINSYVSEMKVPSINSPIGFLVFLCMFGVTLVYCLYKEGKTRLRYSLLLIGTAIMTLSSIRSFSVFCICGIAPLAYYLRNLEMPIENIQPSRKLFTIRGILIILLCGFIVFSIKTKTEAALDQIQKMPLSGAVNYILNNTDVNNIMLYTGYNDGNYAEFMGLKPYIDTRAEVFVKRNNKKDDIMKEYILLQGGKLFYRNILNKYNFTHLIVSKNDILYNYLSYDEDYRIVYSNDEYKVFEDIHKEELN